ncbi:MAG TPA: envelope stress response membrane protein PspC [Chromatiaceae bacterium]|nr:envelope stress response membrane protein PspC [Chromatiaceae bacterium]
MSCDAGCHNKLYRDPDNGKVAGVCAGVADYFSWDIDVVRFATIVAAILFSVTTLAIYVAAAFFLPKKPKDLYDDRMEEQYWRKYRKSPKDTLADTRYRFRKLERKLSRLEAYVTSDRYQLDRELQDLDHHPAR